MSRKKKSIVALLTIVATIAIVSFVVASCSSKKKGTTKSTSSTALGIYPHIPNMRVEHIDQIANMGSVPSSCAACHSSRRSTDLNVNCAQACHTETLSESRAIPLAVASPLSTECKTCHTEPTNPVVGGSKKPFGHYVAEIYLCKLCHTADAQHFQIGPGQTTPVTNFTPDGCYRCHSRKDTEPNVHPALTLFPQDSCIKCHDPHGSDRRYLTKGSSVAALCVTCHSGQISLTGQSVHPPIISGKECLNCHKPHSSTNSKLLIIESENLCLSCHKTGGTAIVPPPSVHTGITGDMCRNCHNPHSCPSSDNLLCP